jgi:xanthine dehydrogenase YagS FAD-binding subunit
MKNFTYYRPDRIELAVTLLTDKWGPAELLAGGTDLHDLQKEYVSQPDKVVSLTGVGGGFTKIEASRGWPMQITIGGGVKLADIAENQTIQANAPALAAAASIIGGPQIRNMGTLGGNLCQRNRCWYFRDEHVHCLLKGGRKCYATDGENQYHAIFTQGHPCVIVHPSTLAPPLIALGATADVQGPNGKRSVELTKFFQAPKDESTREHVLKPNEIVTQVRLSLDEGVKSASYEVRHKQSYDWPLTQAAVAFKLSGGRATNVRVVLGHVGPTPLVSEAAAKALEGKSVTSETATAAGVAACEGAKPLAQNGYKVKLLEVAVKRAALTAAGAKKYWEA